MSRHWRLGKEGEFRAKEYLLRKGYAVLEENWRWQRLEVDLIAEKDNTIVLFEVKTRSRFTSDITEVIGLDKEKNLMQAADAYMKTRDEMRECRIDIILLQPSVEGFEITHIEDAVSP